MQSGTGQLKRVRKSQTGRRREAHKFGIFPLVEPLDEVLVALQNGGERPQESLIMLIALRYHTMSFKSGKKMKKAHLGSTS